MDRKKYEKFKRALIVSILILFVVQKSVVYFQEKKEDSEIIFYTLPEQSEEKNTTSMNNIERGGSIDSSSENAANDTANGSDLININTATSAELQELYRIGPALADRIIEYRSSYGRFETIEEIKEVKGIGEKTFEKIKDRICVK